MSSLCAKVLSLLPKPTSPSRAAATPRQQIVDRFIDANDQFEFAWNVERTTLMVTFNENRRSQNSALLGVVSLLALAYDGREFVTRDTFRPVDGNESEPTFDLALDYPLAPTATELARLTQSKYFGQGPRIKELPISYLTSSYAYTGFSGILNRADRMAVSSQTVNFHYLELHASPEVIRALRQGIRELIPLRVRLRWRLTSRTTKPAPRPPMIPPLALPRPGEYP